MAPRSQSGTGVQERGADCESPFFWSGRRSLDAAARSVPEVDWRKGYSGWRTVVDVRVPKPSCAFTEMARSRSYRDSATVVDAKVPPLNFLLHPWPRALRMGAVLTLNGLRKGARSSPRYVYTRMPGSTLQKNPPSPYQPRCHAGCCLLFIPPRQSAVDGVPAHCNCRESTTASPGTVDSGV